MSAVKAISQAIPFLALRSFIGCKHQSSLGLTMHNSIINNEGNQTHNHYRKDNALHPSHGNRTLQIIAAVIAVGFSGSFRAPSDETDSPEPTAFSEENPSSEEDAKSLRRGFPSSWEGASWGSGRDASMHAMGINAYNLFFRCNINRNQRVCFFFLRHDKPYFMKTAIALDKTSARHSASDALSPTVNRYTFTLGSVPLGRTITLLPFSRSNSSTFAEGKPPTPCW